MLSASSREPTTNKLSPPVCLGHEAKVARASIRNGSIASTCHRGLEVFSGQSVTDLLPQTVVANAVVRTAYPDLSMGKRRR